MLLRQNLPLFSPPVLAQKHCRALLLQFVLAELFEAQEAFQEKQNCESIFSIHPQFFPYDWAMPSGAFNKIKEYENLLKRNFSEEAKVIKVFEDTLKKILISWEKKKRLPHKSSFAKTLRQLYSALEPLLETCKKNENLIFFLLKHRKKIDAMMHEGYFRDYLLRIYPCGLEVLGEKMCDKYHQRGFIAQVAELKFLITELIHV